jgi:hypothetical protein
MKGMVNRSRFDGIGPDRKRILIAQLMLCLFFVSPTWGKELRVTPGRDGTVVLSPASPALQTAFKGTGSGIRGTVTDASTGNPINFAGVTVFTPTGGFVTSFSTPSDGTFEISLASGTYFVIARAGLHVSQIFDGVTCLGAEFGCAAGTPIEVTGGFVEGIDFALDPGGTLAGVIVEETTGFETTFPRFKFFNTDGSLLIDIGAFQSSAGGYGLQDALPPGSYFVVVEVRGFVPLLNPNIPCPGLACSVTSGVPVTLSAGQATSLNFTINIDPAFGAFAGTLTSDTVSPLFLTGVTAYTQGGGFAGDANNTTSDTFVVAGLPAGNYFAATRVIGVFHPDVENELFDDILCEDSGISNTPRCDVTTGDPISVSAGVITLDIDFALGSNGSGVNSIPKPNPDIFTLLEGNSLSGNVTSNDDLGNGLGSVALATEASNGTLSLNPDGNFTYNPDGPGTDVFSYSVTDVDGDTSSATRVTITTAPDPGLAIIIDIDPGGDFAQQLDDAISQANGGNSVVRVRFPPGLYQYSGSAKSLLTTAISGRVVVEAMGTPVTIRGLGPNGGQWLEISQGTLEIKSLIIENFGSGLGGALHAFDGGTLKVSDSTLRNNSSSGLGGAILSGSGAQTTIERSTISGNTASGGGGGVRAESGSSLTVTGSTFLNNTADTGGGISFGDGDANCSGSSCAVIADVNDVTFEGNQAMSGGALSVELSAGDNNDSIRIEKAIFADNSASGTGCDVLVEDQRGTEATDKIVFSDSAFFGDCADSRIEGSVGGFTIADSTVVHDGTGVRGTGTVNLRGTVLTDSSLVGKSGPRADSSKDACETTAGVFNSLGFNVSSDASCGLTQATDLPDTDPMIQRSGKDFSILAGSPILDNGPSELLTLLAGEKPQLPCGYKDTNGLGRPQDSNDDGTYECDIGNVEAKNGPDTSGATSSAYFDPARPGEGVFVEVLDGGLVFLAMFTYQIDASGPVWLVGVGQSVGNTIVVDEMLLTGGGIFGPDFNSDAIVRTPVGGMSMVFRDCSTGDGKPGRLAFQALLGSPFTDLLVDSSRLTTIVNCNQTAPPAFAGRSGSFFDPARNGEGIFVQWQEDGRVLVIWYTYDGDGNQFWTISGDTQVNGSTVTASMLYPAQGTGFGQNFDPSEIVLGEWGTMTLEYDGCNALVLSYDSSLEGFGQGSYNYQRLTTIGGTSCDL